MRAPRFAQPGEPAQEIRVRLELKFLADVGLLGLPNAGKSTFISTISAARPKVAPYPFTTLNPNLGVVVGDDGRRMVVADIPGLIQGAHSGQGLGHTFLKHVERSRFLVHILSAEDISQEDPWAGFEMINEELGKYKTSLTTKKQLLVVNKIDLLTEDELEALAQRARDDGRDLFFISALHGQGVETVLSAMWQEMETIKG
jgi:GTP-binding protein